MSTPLVQLTFALQSFDDSMSAAMSHAMEYEKLSLKANAAHNITLQCVLPDGANESDVISLRVYSSYLIFLIIKNTVRV